jgi:uncharacterized membrane protein HdeD (DUF308 family)
MSRKPEVEMSNDMGDTVVALVGNAWGWVLAFGLLTLAAGIAVLVWPAETLLVVAVLFGIQLVITGIFRFVMAFTEPVRGAGIRVLYAVIGLLSLIVGIWAIRHANLTVLLLAVLLGIFWIVNGVFEIYVALSERALPHRGWTGAMGVLSVFAGLVVVAVPQISVITLAVVLGIWLLFWGIGQIMIAFRLRSAVHSQVGPGERPAREGLWHRSAS